MHACIKMAAKVCCNSTEDLCTTKVLELLATTNDDEMISYMPPLNPNANEVYVFSPGKDVTKKENIRTTLVDFILKNQPKFDTYCHPSTVVDHVSRMRQNGEWGTHAELFAVAL